MPSHQDLPLGVVGRVRRKGKPIRSVPVQLQELLEGVAMLDRLPSGLHSGFSVRVYALSL